MSALLSSSTSSCSDPPPPPPQRKKRKRTSFQQPLQQPRRLPPPPAVPQQAPHPPRVQAPHVRSKVDDHARGPQPRVRAHQLGVGVGDRVEHEGHLPLEDAGAEARGREPAGVAGDVAEDVEGVVRGGRGGRRGGGRRRAAAASVAAIGSLDPDRLASVSFVLVLPPPFSEHLVPDHPDVPPLELRRVVLGADRQGQGAGHVIVGEGVAAREREERRRRFRGRRRRRGPCCCCCCCRSRGAVAASSSSPAVALLFGSGKPSHGELGRVERRRPEELRRRGLRRRRSRGGDDKK